MSTPTSRRHTPLIQLTLIIQALLLPSAVFAITDDIVGTWSKPDKSLVEFKTDGSVSTRGAPVGKWEHLRDSQKYVLRFNGASFREFYYVTTGRYKRHITLELPSNGSRTQLDRVDEGPTVNPDVPDAHEALELEYKDAVASIARTAEALGRAQAEAAEAWQKHYHARSIGRISGWIPVARQKEAAAKGLEGSLASQRESLKKLAVTLGKPVPPEATATAIASTTPAPAAEPAASSGPLSTRSSHKVVSRVRSNQTPLINGPTFVPGTPGVVIPPNTVIQPMGGQFIPGQPMHIQRNPMTGQPIFTR